MRLLATLFVLAGSMLAACGAASPANSVPWPHQRVAVTSPTAARRSPVNTGSPPARARPSSHRRPAPSAAVAAAPHRPRIIQRPIPFGRARRREMAAYARRHYGIRSYRLTHPRVIVEHYTETSTARAAFNTFAPDRRDTELHELPGVCAHYVIDRDGRILQLVSTAIMCRHTVGLNYTAIGIEIVAFSDRQVLRNSRQLRAALRLTAWLRCRLAITLHNVIGHNESLRSGYHRERVRRLRKQTHSDWKRADMNVFRGKLSRTACR